MRTSDDISSIAPAFVAFQSLLDNPLVKDAKAVVEECEYKYGSLPALIAYIREPAALCDLSFTQDVTTLADRRGVAITTRCLHSSGQWYEWGPVEIACQPDAQSVGSATTYGMRYGLRAAANVIAADEDDDAAAATRVQQAAGEDREGRREAPAAPPASSKPRTATVASVRRLLRALKAVGRAEAEVLTKYKVADLADLTQDTASALITKFEAEARKA